MISTTTTTMTASPTTTAAHRAPNRERLDGGTDVKLPARVPKPASARSRAPCAGATRVLAPHSWWHTTWIVIIRQGHVSKGDTHMTGSMPTQSWVWREAIGGDARLGQCSGMSFETRSKAIAPSRLYAFCV